jgi:hypothetical protein
VIDLLVYPKLELINCTLLIDPRLPNGAVLLQMAHHSFQLFGFDYWFHQIHFCSSTFS